MELTNSFTDPSYLRSIRDGILNGNIEAYQHCGFAVWFGGLYD